MFLTREQLIKRFIKKVLYGIGCFIFVAAVELLLAWFLLCN